MAFSFGAKTTASTNLFGQNTTSTGFGAKTSGGSLFGGGTGTAFGFGKPTTASTSTGFTGFKSSGGTGFGTGTGLFSNTQNQIPQLQQQPSTQESVTAMLLNMASALSAPLVLGDERDAVLAKWNQIQAFWGTGKGYYRKDGANVVFTPENHFCRFKAIGYSCLPKMKDEQGLLAITVTKKETEIKHYGNEKISQVVHGILDSKPNLSVKVDSIRALPGDKTEITIYVEEQSTATGNVKRVPASELYAFVCQQRIQQKLQQNMAAESCVPRAAIKPEQIKQILENPPSGIDAIVWEQAKSDNPDPESLIPVPMIGFNELRNRLIHQESMAKQHQSRLEILSEKLHELQEMQVNTQSKIEQYKRQYLQMSHRVLQVVIAQEICRKAGFAIQPDEEQLRVQLEALFSELTAPTQCRGRLNEMLSQMRMQHHHHTLISSVHSGQTTPEREGGLDEEALTELKLHLKKQQQGLNTLISLLKEDFDDLKLMEKEMAKEISIAANVKQADFVVSRNLHPFAR